MIRVQRILGALLLITLFLVVGFWGYRKFVVAQTYVDIDKIKIIPFSSSNLPSGLSYSFQLKNETGHTIKQNAVYLSFPIKNSNGESRNNSKIEATGNKIDIKPNEELTLNFFCPREDYASNPLLDIQHPELEIKGYMDDVTQLNHFEKAGGLSFFK